MALSRSLKDEFRAGAVLATALRKQGWSYPKAGRISSFVTSWCAQATETGIEPTGKTFAKYWHISEAKAFEDLALFREAAGGEWSTPTEFAEWYKTVAPAAELTGTQMVLGPL